MYHQILYTGSLLKMQRGYSSFQTHPTHPRGQLRKISRRYKHVWTSSDEHIKFQSKDGIFIVSTGWWCCPPFVGRSWLILSLRSCHCLGQGSLAPISGVRGCRVLADLCGDNENLFVENFTSNSSSKLIFSRRRRCR